MRVTLRAIAAVASIAAVAFACGSSDESLFGSGDGKDAGVVEPPPGPFVTDDGGAGPGPTTCKPQTCADQKASCGPIGDGCGGVVQCGACTGSDSCGGGGVPSQCGKPACTKLTCAAQSANCGAAADGCGGVIASCGGCDAGAGEICGGGGPSRCGLGAGGGDGGADGGVICIPKTCVELGANCGPAADGCGGLIASCGKCDAAIGESCGGAGVPSVCGKACKPKTACAAGQNCGPIADGCGGIINCGVCAAGSTCGGVTPNVCAAGAPCTDLCTQQATCPGGGTTSISGTVTTPNRVLPISGALVYVPNTGAVAPFTAGVSCDQCGAAASGSPLVTATTGPDGKFLLTNVPVSSAAAGKVMDIPVVIQLGRWRKQFTIQTTACVNTPVTATKTALPHNKTEGDIPLTAISTGNVDGLECVFRKIGIDDAEFTNPSGNGRIRLYKDNGAVITAQAGVCSGTGRSCTNFTGTCGFCANNPSRSCSNIGGSCNRGDGDCTAGGTCNQTAGTPPASALYNDPNELAKYDMTIFECVGRREDKTNTAQANVRDYANMGGRVYATHFSYVWLYNAGASPWNATAAWAPDSDSWSSATATLETSFGKGQAFAQWLNIVGGLQAPLPSPAPPWNPPPKITIRESRHDVNDPIVAPAQRWLYTTAADSPNVPSVQHYTFNTDWAKPQNQQCGRVLYSDFHVSTNSSTNDAVFPNECDNNALSTQEKVLAFMLFDLASCVSAGPPATACTPRTCAEQGIQCGQAGDGCGNVIKCPDCAAGLTCGGGGQPNVCGKPPCTPKVCGGGQCGMIADGCGGSVDCGNCAAGTCGGGGTANQCGAGTCNALTCPTPAPGSVCGPVADGCGRLLDCQCPPNTPCVNGKCGAPPCAPRTCPTAGANCGQIADGCGALLDCGPCLAPQTCGGGGTPNVCGGGPG